MTWAVGRMDRVRTDVSSPFGEISMFKARWREEATETSFWNWLLRLLSTLQQGEDIFKFSSFSFSVHIEVFSQ